jgi:hypothetical protein
MREPTENDAIRVGLPNMELDPPANSGAQNAPAYCLTCGQPLRLRLACPHCGAATCSENCQSRHYRRKHLVRGFAGTVLFWGIMAVLAAIPLYGVYLLSNVLLK